MNDSYFQSQDFKRATGNLSDSGIKFVFKWIEIGFKAVVNFIKSMWDLVLGK